MREDGAVVQKTDYYPFGLPYADSSHPECQPYKYNGKEYDRMHGLNRYDYSARYYDPVFPVFTSIDPLAEKYYSWSPYVYCLNNPVRYVDSTGKFPVETIWDIGNVIYDVGAAVVNHIEGNHEVAKSNWRDFGLDVASVLLPYVPGGTSKVLKGADILVKPIGRLGR